MDKQQIDDQIAAIRRHTEEILAQGPEACRKFLEKLGLELEPAETPSPSISEDREIPEGPWKVIPHSFQLGDTGDWDGYYELTDGKISIMTKDDWEDDAPLKIVADALNKVACDFYLDDSDKWLYHHEKQRADDLQSLLSAKEKEAQEYRNIIEAIRKRKFKLGDFDVQDFITDIIRTVVEKYPNTQKDSNG